MELKRNPLETGRGTSIKSRVVTTSDLIINTIYIFMVVGNDSVLNVQLRLCNQLIGSQFKSH